VAGTPEIGMISRGEDAEITTYLEAAVTSELSGNLADICPVGALTHKPWAFNYRPWELKKTDSIDVMDALGSAIRVDARGAEVMRVLPRINEEINEEWISDKTRHACDGLMRQRLDRPYVRKSGRLVEATWAEAFAAIAAKAKKASPDRIGVIAGDLQDAESMKAAKDLFAGLGSKNLDCRQDGAKIGGGARAGYLFNTTILGLEQADALLLIGTNPRKEAALVNARIRKTWLQGKMKVGVIGEQADLKFDYDYLGAGPASLKDFAKTEFGKAFKAAERPAIVVGAGVLSRADGAAVLAAAAKLGADVKVVRDGWNGFNVLHTAASRVGGLDMGFLPGEGGLDVAGMLQPGALDVLFLLGADELDLSGLSKTFVVYVGSHGDAGASAADVILPGAAYTEKPGLYVNTEGRVQAANRAVFPKGEAREDWAIVRALSEHLGAKLPYDTLEQLRAKLFADHPSFGQIDYVAPAAALDLKSVGGAGDVGDAAFACPVDDFYLTNPIARASVTMAECSALAASQRAPLAAE
jgi:NADH-quinone oxidoreductase subunit G